MTINILSKEDLTQSNQLGTQLPFSEKIIMLPQRKGLLESLCLGLLALTVTLEFVECNQVLKS